MHPYTTWCGEEDLSHGTQQVHRVPFGSEHWNLVCLLRSPGRMRERVPRSSIHFFDVRQRTDKAWHSAHRRSKVAPESRDRQCISCHAAATRSPRTTGPIRDENFETAFLQSNKWTIGADIKVTPQLPFELAQPSE
jgi:hypothetical protein